MVRRAWGGGEEDSRHTDERLVTYKGMHHIHVYPPNNGNHVCHCQRKINWKREKTRMITAKLEL